MDHVELSAVQPQAVRRYKQHTNEIQQRLLLPPSFNQPSWPQYGVDIRLHGGLVPEVVDRQQGEEAAVIVTIPLLACSCCHGTFTAAVWFIILLLS